jgi:hypothetical protein
MFGRRCRRVAMVLSMLGLSLLTAGCTDNPREPGGGGKASGATEQGGGAVTTASPGGANVRPDEGTNAGVR